MNIENNKTKYEIINTDNKFNRKGNASKKIIIGVVAISIVILFYLVIQNNKTIEVPETAPTKETKEQPKEEEIKPKTEEVPNIEKNPETNIKVVENEMKEMLKHVNEFFIAYVDYTSFVTKNGFLYDFPTKDYVTKDNLFEEGINLSEHIYFLYLKEKDINKLVGMTLENEEDLKVCLVTNVNDEIIFLTEGIDYKTIDKDYFYNVFDEYKTESSMVEGFQVLKSKDDMKKIVKVLNDYTGIEKFDFRSLSRDDRYAIVTASPQGKPNDVKQFILEKTKNWEVVMDNIDEELKPYISVNKKLVNFNLELMPSYSIKSFKEHMVDDVSPVVEAIRADEQYVVADDELVFSCGTDYYIYLEFKSGTRLICSFTEDQFWMVYPVNSYEEGYILMLSFNEKVPTFIIRQNY